MNKGQKTIFGITLFLIILSTIIFAIFFYKAPKENTDVTEKTSATYVLKEYDGKIGIFKEGQNMPLEILETYIEFLPQKDREMIKSGIRIESEGDLARVISDYSK